MAKRNQQVEGEEKVKFSREGYQKAKQIIVYLKDYKYHFFAGMILLVLSSSLFMAFPVLAGELLNEASGKGTYGLTLDQIGLLIIGILVLQGVFSYTRVWLFAIISEKGMANIRKSFYNKLISLPITFFEENRVGELTSRSASDVQQLHYY